MLLIIAFASDGLFLAEQVAALDNNAVIHVTPGTKYSMSPEVVKYLNRGNEALSGRQYETAVECFTQAIALDPKLADAYHNRAVAFHILGKYQRALDDTNIEIALGGADASSYECRGECFYMLGQYQKAIESLDRALQIGDPNPEFAAVARGWREDAYKKLTESRSSSAQRTSDQQGTTPSIPASDKFDGRAARNMTPAEVAEQLNQLQQKMVANQQYPDLVAKETPLQVQLRNIAVANGWSVSLENGNWTVTMPVRKY